MFLPVGYIWDKIFILLSLIIMETRRTNGYKTLGFFQKVKLADSTKNKIVRP